MKNIYKKFILVGITSLSLISCNIIDNHQSASIETKLEDIKLSNDIMRNHPAGWQPAARLIDPNGNVIETMM